MSVHELSNTHWPYSFCKGQLYIVINQTESKCILLSRSQDAPPPNKKQYNNIKFISNACQFWRKFKKKKSKMCLNTSTVTLKAPCAVHDCKPADLRTSRKSETLLRVKINCPTTRRAALKLRSRHNMSMGSIIARGRL